jgi:hypothetical protein
MIGKNVFTVDVKIYYCKVCCLLLNNEENVNQHVESQSHCDNLNKEVNITVLLYFNYSINIYFKLNNKVKGISLYDI